MTTNTGMQNLLQFPELSKTGKKLKASARGIAPHKKRETFDLKEGRSMTCGGFRLSTNQR